MGNKQLKALRRKQDFDTLKFNGSKVHPSKWLLISFKENGLDHSRFGWTISGKVGNAVVRNRLKRWCREYFRSVQQFSKKQLDINVVVKPGNQDFYRQLRHEDALFSLAKAWTLIQKQLN